MLRIIIVLILVSGSAAARDLGQWETQPSHQYDWFQKLMQPDNPSISCCGEADAYWADSFEVNDGRYVAVRLLTPRIPSGQALKRPIPVITIVPGAGSRGTYDPVRSNAEG
jgi:hypothetical protein